MRISDWSSDVCSSDLENDNENGGKLPKRMGVAELFPLRYITGTAVAGSAGYPLSPLLIVIAPSTFILSTPNRLVKRSSIPVNSRSPEKYSLSVERLNAASSKNTYWKIGREHD